MNNTKQKSHRHTSTGFSFWRAGRDKPLSRLSCLSTQRLCLSVPAYTTHRYKTVHRTILLYALCPLSVRVPRHTTKKDEPPRWDRSSFWRAGRDFVSALPAPIASLSLVAAPTQQSTGLLCLTACSSPSRQFFKRLKQKRHPFGCLSCLEGVHELDALLFFDLCVRTPT